MDDFKRAMYVDALQAIERRRSRCVCAALIAAYEMAMGASLIAEATDWQQLYTLTKAEFPEFFRLYDGYKWSNGQCEETPQNGFWWTLYDYAPRIRILKCILATH